MEALLNIGEDGKLTIELPEEAAPGRYQVSFVLKKWFGLRKISAQPSKNSMPKAS
ncbi:MAG: hypothetical protein AAFU53_13710 [Cyanobacteria bacterium J06632_3]